jgi:shikimate kinase
MKKNIMLVGLMGAGKSTIGRHLAKQLKMEFYDSDNAIEKRTGVSIATIFEIEGEKGFRAREEQMITELCQYKNIILATGGGSVLRKANRLTIQKAGHVIYLSTTAEQLYKRIRHDKSRPLMQTENPLQTLTNLLNEREPYYLDIADSIIKTGQQRVSVVINKILTNL